MVLGFVTAAAEIVIGILTLINAESGNPTGLPLTTCLFVVEPAMLTLLVWHLILSARLTRRLTERAVSSPSD